MPPDRLAVLVDADNVEAGHIAFAVRTAGHHGTVVLKRAFGRLDSVVGRADVLTRHGFTAEVVLPPPGNAKNAADLMLAQYASALPNVGLWKRWRWSRRMVISRP